MRTEPAHYPALSGFGGAAAQDMRAEKDYNCLKCRASAGFPRMTQAEERLTRG
jgi:hypothetical protein